MHFDVTPFARNYSVMPCITTYHKDCAKTAPELRRTRADRGWAGAGAGLAIQIGGLGWQCTHKTAQTALRTHCCATITVCTRLHIHLCALCIYCKTKLYAVLKSPELQL